MVNGSTDQRVLSIFLAKSMAAIFYFNDSGRLGIERNLYQEGVNGQNKEGGGEGVKIAPAWGHCYFTKLRSSTNGVPDWCG